MSRVRLLKWLELHTFSSCVRRERERKVRRTTNIPHFLHSFPSLSFSVSLWHFLCIHCWPSFHGETVTTLYVGTGRAVLGLHFKVLKCCEYQGTSLAAGRNNWRHYLNQHISTNMFQCWPLRAILDSVIVWGVAHHLVCVTFIHNAPTIIGNHIKASQWLNQKC